MRPGLLWLLATAAASKWPDPPTDAVDAYVRSWAAGGTARRCGDVGAHGDCSWMSGFGPIDVACTIHIDRVGLLDDKHGPALTSLARGRVVRYVTNASVLQSSGVDSGRAARPGRSPRLDTSLQLSQPLRASPGIQARAGPRRDAAFVLDSTRPPDDVSTGV